MADDGKAAAPVVDLDAEGLALRLQAEKAKFAEAIAKARKGADEAGGAVLPAIADAPKGEVALGASAGAFGPWRAHQAVDEVAVTIANRVASEVGAEAGARVLIVDDQTLLAGHWAARQLRATLERLGVSLTETTSALSADLARLEGVGTEDAQPTSRRRGASSTDEYATRFAPTTAAAGGFSGALGTAVNLFGLLRADHTVTATAVSATASELATLVAAHLAARVTVEADGFTTVGTSPSEKLLAEAVSAREAAATALRALRIRSARVEAEVTATAARAAQLEQTWAAAVVEGKDAATLLPLRTVLDALHARLATIRAVLAPTVATLTEAAAALATADTVVQSVLTSSGNHEPPIVTALRRERLEQAAETARITHVLHVTLDSATSDAVTRRSVLGTSGHLRHFSAANATWLLLDARTGTICSGGHCTTADSITLELDSADLHFATPDQWSALRARAKDPLQKLESNARMVVLALIVVFGLFALLSACAVVRMATGWQW